MSKTHQYLNYLNEHIGIAPANSQEELQAAQTISEVMQDHAVEPVLEEFSTPTGSQIVKPLVTLLMLLALIFSGLGGALGLVGSLICLALVALLLAARFGRSPFEKMGPQVQSQNVVAFHAQTGPNVMKGNRPIVIIAHYDTPRVNPLMNHPFFARFYAQARKATPICIYIVGIAALIQLFVFLPEPLRRVFWFIGVIAAVVPAVLAVADIMTRYGDCTDGANDNKSSVAALLSVLSNVRPGPDVALDAEAMREQEEQQRRAREAARKAREEEEAAAAAAEAAAKAKAEAERLARYKRHGEATIEALGMLPPDCQIEYEAPRVEEIPAEPAAAEQPAEEEDIEETSVYLVPDSEKGPRHHLGSLISRVREKAERRDEEAPAEDIEAGDLASAPVDEAVVVEEELPAEDGEAIEEETDIVEGVQEADEEKADESGIAGETITFEAVGEDEAGKPAIETETVGAYQSVTEDSPYSGDAFADKQHALWPNVLDAEWEPIVTEAADDAVQAPSDGTSVGEPTPRSESEGESEDEEETDLSQEGEETVDAVEAAEADDGTEAVVEEEGIVVPAEDGDEAAEKASGDESEEMADSSARFPEDVAAYVDSLFAEELGVAAGTAEEADAAADAAEADAPAPAPEADLSAIAALASLDAEVVPDGEKHEGEEAVEEEIVLEEEPSASEELVESGDGQEASLSDVPKWQPVDAEFEPVDDASEEASAEPDAAAGEAAEQDIYEESAPAEDIAEQDIVVSAGEPSEDEALPDEPADEPGDEGFLVAEADIPVAEIDETADAEPLADTEEEVCVLETSDAEEEAAEDVPSDEKIESVSVLEAETEDAVADVLDEMVDDPFRFIPKWQAVDAEYEQIGEMPDDDSSEEEPEEDSVEAAEENEGEMAIAERAALDEALDEAIEEIEDEFSEDADTNVVSEITKGKVLNRLVPDLEEEETDIVEEGVSEEASDIEEAAEEAVADEEKDDPFHFVPTWKDADIEYEQIGSTADEEEEVPSSVEDEEDIVEADEDASADGADEADGAEDASAVQTLVEEEQRSDEDGIEEEEIFVEEPDGDDLPDDEADDGSEEAPMYADMEILTENVMASEDPFDEPYADESEDEEIVRPYRPLYPDVMDAEEIEPIEEFDEEPADEKSAPDEAIRDAGIVEEDLEEQESAAVVAAEEDDALSEEPSEDAEPAAEDAPASSDETVAFMPVASTEEDIVVAAAEEEDEEPAAVEEPSEEEPAIELPDNFHLDMEAEQTDDPEIAPKDLSGVVIESEEIVEEAEPEPYEKPAMPDDPEWGRTSFKPAFSDMSRRVLLADLPDPSEHSIDPFNSGRIDDQPIEAADEDEDDTLRPHVQTGEFDVITPESLDRIAEETRKSRRHRFFGRGNEQGHSYTEHVPEHMQEESPLPLRPHHKTNNGWKGGATPKDELRLPQFDLEGEEPEGVGYELDPERADEVRADMAAVQEAQDVVVENVPDEAEEARREEIVTQEELRDAVLSMNDDDLIAHDIWFVAAGGSGLDNAGVKAFLEEHRRDIRGAFLINLDCVGAGTPTVLSQEGLDKPKRADRRLVRMFQSIAHDLGFPLGKARYELGDTDATPAMRSHVRSVTIMGLDDNGLPAYSHTIDDVPDTVNPDQVAEIAELVTELIRQS